jgi:membrane associated rhomboid family serine protease
VNRNTPQYRVVWPPFTPSVIGLSIAFFLLWIGPVLIQPFGEVVGSHLILTLPAVVERYQVWTLATYGFFHSDFFGVFFSALALWLFGGEMERRWSAKKWWIVIVSAVVLGGVFDLLGLWVFGSPMPVRGFQAPIMALLTAFCWLHWRSPLNMFFFSMSGRTMLLFFLGLGVLMAALSGYWPVIGLDAAGVAVGFLASTRTLNPRDLRVRFRNWRARRKLKLVRSPESKPNGKAKPNGKSNGIHYN